MKFKRLTRCICLMAILMCQLTVPATPVAAADLSWSVIPTPVATASADTSGQLCANTDMDFFAITPDDSTMFAYDNTSHLFYKSLDGGISWTSQGIGGGLEGDIDGSGTANNDDNLVAMVISPDYAADKTVIAAIKRKVFFSSNGGTIFHEAGSNLAALLDASAAITSLDYAPSLQGVPTIFIGVKTGTQNGGIYALNLNTGIWRNLNVGDWNGDGSVTKVIEDCEDPWNEYTAPSVTSISDGADKKVGNNSVKLIESGGLGVGSSVIEDCEDIWDVVAGSGVTSVIDNVDFKVGPNSVKLEGDGTLAAGALFATEGMAAIDLRTFKYLEFWIKSTVATNAIDDLQILLDDNPGCTSPLETLNVGIIADDIWTQVKVALAAPLTLSAVVSIGIRQNVALGAINIWLDDIRTTADGILATEAITSVNLTVYSNLEFWIKSSIPIGPVDGLQILLDKHPQCQSPEVAVNAGGISANTWTRLKLPLTASYLLTPIISIGIRQTIDLGPMTLWIDSIIATEDTCDVLSVACSPNIETDSGILAVVNYQKRATFPIDNCEDSWGELLVDNCDSLWSEYTATSVVSSVDDTGMKVGIGSVKLVEDGGLAAGGIFATKTIGPLDLSPYKDLVYWIKSSINTANGDLQILLDDIPSCVSPNEIQNVPALAANTWMAVRLPLSSPSYDWSIKSIGIRQAPLVDKGAMTIWIDQVKVVSYAASVTSSVDNTDKMVGLGSVKLVESGALGIGSIIAVKELSLMYISSYTSLEFWIKSSIPTTAAGDLQILLDDSRGCLSPLEALDVGIIPANEWRKVKVAFNEPANIMYLRSIAIRQSTDLGTLTIWLDDFKATSDYLTMLTSKFGTYTWGATVANAAMFAEICATATMAFPADFEWSTYFRVFVGTSGSTCDDVYLVSGGISGYSSSVYDLNASGQLETEVHSIAVKGIMEYEPVLIGQKGSSTIIYAYSISSIYIYWYVSSKSPTGSTNAIVAWAHTDEIAYTATSGIGSALSRSTDNGTNWNQIGMIDISTPGNLSILDVACISDQVIFLLMWDNLDNLGTYVAGDYTMLFKTTDGGSTWQQVLAHRTSATDALTIVRLSPYYHNDNTVYVAQNDKKIWKSSDGGTSFYLTSSQAGITALLAVDGYTYYTGHTNAFYKSSQWTTSPSFDGDTIMSIAVAPNRSAIFVGTNDGDVYMSTDGGITFTLLGLADSLGDNATVSIAIDPDYATSKTVFAGSSDAGFGVRRWVVGTSTEWKHIISVSCSALVMSDEGVLYAASNIQNEGFKRSLTPKAELKDIRPESVIFSLPGGAKLDKMAIIPDSNTLVAVASNLARADYGYPYSLLTFNDTMVVTPELLSPLDKTSAPQEFTLIWSPVVSPWTLTYHYEIATDSSFNNIVKSGDTTSVTVNISNLPRGSQYWWRVYVVQVNQSSFRSKKSDVRTFFVALPPPVIRSPDYGVTDVSLKPSFSWLPVTGATSYELELTDNLDYKYSWIEKRLIHTVWSWKEELKYSTSYYWRVRAVAGKENAPASYSPWTEAVFTTISKPVVTAPRFIVDTLPPPVQQTITVPVMTVTVPPPPISPPSHLTPFHVRLMIAIYSILFLGIIILIINTVKTRLF